MAIAPLLLAAPPAARAGTTDTWTAGDGNWSTAANWTNTGNTHTVPAAGDTVKIVNGDGVARTITYDYAGPAISLTALTIDLTGAGSNVDLLSMSSNTLSVNGGELIGLDGRGSFNQSGGSNTVTDSTGTGFQLGSNSGSTGTYSLSGSASLTVSTVGASFYEIIGTFGAGTFTQSGGANSAGILDIAHYAGSAGTYNLNAGTFTIVPAGGVGGSNAYIGGNPVNPGGTGVLNISGGSLSVAGTLKIYSTAGSALNFSGGSLSTAGITNLGTLSYALGSGGVRQISGGAVTNSGVISGVDGHISALTVSGLNLNSGGDLKFEVGSSFSSDLITVQNFLGLSVNGATTVDITSLGGLVPGRYTLIDYNTALQGSFANLSLGSTPAGAFSYALDNNLGNTSIDLVVQISPSAFIWNGGIGSWSQPGMWSGGVVPNSATAHVLIDNGNPAASAVSLDQNAAVADITLDAGDSLTIGANFTLTLSGPATSVLSGPLSNHGTLAVTGGAAQLNSSAAHSGTFTVAAGAALDFHAGTHTLADNVKFGGSGTVSFTGATVNAGRLITAPVAGDNVTLNLSGGSFTSTANFFLGSVGSATVNQTGGTASIAFLIMGQNQDGSPSGGNGSYSISAGTLNLTGNGFFGPLLVGYYGAGTLAVSGSATVSSSGPVEVGTLSGSTGTFTHSGGSVTIGTSANPGSGALFIGRNSGATGTCHISQGATATTLQVYGNLYAGYDGSGAVIQDGGSVTLTGGGNVGYLQIAANSAGASGSYTINGGMLQTDGDIDVGGYAGGANGTGSFTVNSPGGPGGTNVAINQILRVWSTGTATINGGNVTANNGTGIAAGATLTITGGTFTSIGPAGGTGIACSGTIHLTGGTLNVSNDFNIDGSVNNDGGTINVSSRFQSQSGTGVYIQTAGTLNLASGSDLHGGTFNITGGTVTSAGQVTFGSGAGGSATVTFMGNSSLSVGTLIEGPNGGSANTVFKGNSSGTIGGGLAINSLTVTDQATLTVLDQAPPPGEDPELNRAIVGGYQRDGTINVNGGTVTAPLIKLGITIGKTGTYTQTAGAVTVGTLAAGNDASLTSGMGTGNVTISGGTLSADTVLLGSTRDGSGTMTVSGTAAVTVGGGLAFNDLIVNGGSVTVLDQNPPAGEDSELNRSMVGGYLHDGAMQVHGGTVSSPNIKLGVTIGMTGTLSQDGGTITVTTLGVGNDADQTKGQGNGFCGVTGGTLNAGTILLGSTAGPSVGLLHIAGGVVTAGSIQMVANTQLAHDSGTMNVGPVTVASGGYVQSAAAVENHSGDFLVAASGTATFGGPQTWTNGTVLMALGGTTVLFSDAGSTAAYHLGVKITPATGTATVHITGNNHLRDLRVNTVQQGGAGLLFIDAAKAGNAFNPTTHFGAAGGSVAVYVGDGAGNSGVAPRASVENLWKSAALEGYWALRNGSIGAITRGLTMDPSLPHNSSSINGLVVMTSVDEAGQPVTYVGENVIGDVNGDARIDVNDVTQALAHLNKVPGTVAGEAGYTLYTPSEGDVNGDLVVDVNDITAILANLGKNYTPAQADGGAAPIPEPASLLLAAMGGGIVLRRRRHP